MITVRFPSGLSVQYNDAHFTLRDTNPDTVILKTSRGGACCAIIVGTCIIEHMPPDRIYNPLQEVEDDLAKEVKLLRRQVAVMSKKRVR